MTHIFVALGQNHINKFEDLIKNNCLEEGQKILLAGSNVFVNEKVWDKTIISNASFNNNATSSFKQLLTIIKKIKAYSGIIKQLEQYKTGSVTVYVSYIEDVLSNFIFFNFNKKAKAIVVEDGTLNYYNHSYKNINKIKFNFKKVFARLHKIKFQKYKGHSSGAEYSHVISNFVIFPEHAFVKTNAKQLPIKLAKINKPLNALYIIGQEPYGNILGQKEFEKKLTLFFNSIKAQNFYKKLDKIYYKPHRNGTQMPVTFLTSSFEGKELQVLISDKTSEELFFEEIPCAYICSFDSSSLSTIYSKLPEKMRINFNFYVYSLLDNELIYLFKKLNFNFLNKD